MKRIIAVLVLLCLFLTGCGQRIKEPVTFYYLKADYQEEMTDMIVSETREAAGHREDLSYLMALYFMGPAEDKLVSPLPRGSSIFSCKFQNSAVILDISNTDKSLTDSEFTLACACLTLTCLDLTAAEAVTINSGDRSITMNWDILTLQDIGMTAPPEETQ